MTSVVRKLYVTLQRKMIYQNSLLPRPALTILQCPELQQLIYEGPRARVAYPTKKCVELPEMHKNGLNILPSFTLRRYCLKIEYSECSETHFARTPHYSHCTIATSIQVEKKL